MPSSVGHAIAGLAVSRLFGSRLRDSWPAILLATAPDLDILAAVATGRKVDYTRRRSHSAGAALAAGVATGGAAWLLGGRFVSSAVQGTVAYTSHLLLDYFGKERSNGLLLLWPASNRHFSSDHQVFRTIYSSRDHFFTGLMTTRNLKRVAREIAIVSPGALAADVIGRILSRSR